MDNSNIKYDLILVGTGFASSFFLKKYLDKQSNAKSKVLVLERGIFYPHADRLATMRGKDPAYVAKLVAREDTIVNPNPKKPWVFDPNFGGSSNCWWACTPRLMPSDFKLKTLHGVAQDWPFSYEELEPYYCETEELMDISGPEVTPYFMSKKYPLPSHVLSTFDKLMQKKYGDKMYISQPTARASRATKSRNSCCSNYSCNVCPSNAKFTIENGLGNIYADPRVEIRYHSQVLRVRLENNVAKGVQVKTNGSTYEVAGEVIALGANTIFNAHIMLNSGDTSPLLGKGLCEQSGVFAHVFLDNFMNVGGSSALTANGYSMYEGDFRKEYGSCLIEHHNLPLVRNEKGRWRDIARFKFVFEDLPSDTNSVKLSDNEDKPLVDFSGHTSYAEKAFTNLKATINKVFEGLPVENVILDDFFQDTEFHSLSSVRMGKSAADSVVDGTMVHHKYRNLLIMGGSAFPTVSAANPSLTISAMSLRAADKLFN